MRDALVFGHPRGILRAALRMTLRIGNQYKDRLTYERKGEQSCDGGKSLANSRRDGVNDQTLHDDDLQQDPAWTHFRTLARIAQRRYAIPNCCFFLSLN